VLGVLPKDVLQRLVEGIVVEIVPFTEPQDPFITPTETFTEAEAGVPGPVQLRE
jgi:hypothetical protein